MGPQHPSMHGVLRLIVTLDGEDVVDCEPILGYLHRGMEKIAENRTIIQYLPYVTRWDYLATMGSEYQNLLQESYFLERVEGVGIIGRDEAKLGFIGTNATSFGIEWDLRKVDHYESYDEFDWRVQWQREGDSLARYLLGRNSGGPYENLEMRRFDRLKDPEWNDFEYRFIRDRGVFPWRWKIRPPSFINLQILPQTINPFSKLESLKEVYGIIWMLVPIVTLVLGITIGVLVIVWLEREISAGIQQRIGPEYAGPLGILQALADGTKLLLKENLIPSTGDTRLFRLGHP
ncbi:hypothetical protein H5410_057969 [Solanum commersonii]|uniref:NADH-quinone oxidoreductase subunit D domain-containing protein n=1 Tax=Solanum commersonii TaxID=4109 RepID=A0A9J5WPD3_SOLCO|nr:hypothetical protein H5410_057969 [Solanum commersonii]